MSKKNPTSLGRACASVLLTALLACSLSACKSTDFFTEVLISSQADTVDEDNPDRVTINSPDAQKESSALAALRWTDDSSRSEDVENLVTWSADPNSVFTTRHSVYDLTPLFPGIQASDGVRLVFDYDATLDHQVDTDSSQSRNDMQSVSAGDVEGQGSTHSNQTAFSSDATAAGGTRSGASTSHGSQESPEEGTGNESENTGTDNPGDAAGGDTSGKNDGTQTSSNPSDSSGTTEDKYAGFGGSLAVFDSHNVKTEIPKVDSIAVIGKQVAVLTEAIGGPGSICAMSEAAYSGTETNTVSTFSQVFASEVDASVVLWEADDSSIQNVSAATLAAACQGNTLVVYDQSLGDQTTFFTDEQLKELYGAGVRYVLPVDFSSEDGMCEAAYLIGQALSDSANLAESWDSAAMADKYITCIDNVVKAVCKTHAGTWVYGDEQGENTLDTSYYGDAGTGTSTYVHGLIAVDAATGYTYSPYNGAVDASRVVLFGSYGGYANSPLGFWMQAAGIGDTLSSQNSAKSQSDALTLLWGTANSIDDSNLSGSGGAYTRWIATGGHTSDMFGGTRTNTDGGSTWGGGLGSKNMPYLVVCGSSDGTLTGAQVKELVVDSIQGGSVTPYTAYAYTGNQAVTPYDSTIRSLIGDTHERLSANPFMTGLDANDVVRVNPTGLLGNWTGASVEGFLETVWLASIYSQNVEGCGYESSIDMSKLSVEMPTLDGANVTCTTCQQVVEQFYETFYRFDVNYEAVVTDQGA